MGSDLIRTTRVETARGAVRGFVAEGGVQVFKGVPYAQAARFRSPVAATAWTGERDAVASGPIAPQNDDDGLGAYASFRQDEDCLSLNIWTPGTRGKRPVLVWFHGGALVTGTGAFPLFSGHSLCRNHDMVVVTINYRLGVLGWPPFRMFADEDTNNLGLIDCVAALAWVRENIAAFGGDPGNVTQSGQSAGAMISAMLGLLDLPAAYAKAAPLSLQTLVALDPERQARDTRDVLAALDLGQDDLRKLIDAPVADLLRAQWRLRQTAQNAIDTVAQIRWPFVPNQDGSLILEDPSARVAVQDRRTPLLTGSTTEELLATPMALKGNPVLAALWTRDAVGDGLRRLFGEAAAERVWRTYERSFPGASEGDVAGMISGDKDYRLPALRLAEAGGEPAAFVYAFAYRGRGENYPTAHHALDLPFWFGTLADPRFARFFLGGEATPGELDLSRRMQAALAGLARGGDPGWARYEAPDRPTMVFDVEGGVQNDPWPDTRRVWDGLI